MTALTASLANAVLFIAALGFGSLLCRFIPERFSALDRFAVVLLSGIGLLGTFIFCIGLFWFTRPSIILILFFGAVLGLKFFAKAMPEFLEALARVSLPVLPALIVSAVLLVTCVGGLAEPVGDIKSDQIAYHLLGPKVWLRNAVIAPVPDEAYTAFPAVVETQYAAVMSIGGQRAPEFFSVIALISILLIGASLAIRFGLGPSGAWWTAALMITMPVLYRGAFGGFVDAIYSALVLAALRIGFDAGRPGQYALCGMLCGFAMGTKYTGLIATIVLLLCVFLFGTSAPGQKKHRALKYILIACSAAIVAAPWYLRNWVLLGSPIYPPPPLLSCIFNVRYLSPDAIRLFHDSIWKAGEGMGHGTLDFLLLPFHLTFHPANFLNGAGGIGLAPLAFAPFALLARRHERIAQAFALFALLQTIAWFITEQEARFLIHVYVLAALFAVCGWRQVTRTSSRVVPALAVLVVAVSITYGLFMIVSARADDVRSALSASFETKRERDEIPFLDSFRYLNRGPSVTKVLVLNPRVPTYYLDKHYLKPIGRWGEHALPESDDLEEILRELPGLQISDILDVQLDGSPFRLPEHPKALTLVFEQAGQRIYRRD